MEQQLLATQNKRLVIDLMSTYFDVINSKPFRSCTISDLEDYFQEHSAQENTSEWSRGLLGEQYNSTAAARFFYPQLMFFFARFFDIYDNATKGQLMDQVMTKVEKERESEHLHRMKQDPGALRNLWQSQKTPQGPVEPLKGDQGLWDSSEASTPAAEEELVKLQEREETARMDWQALWAYKGDAFRERWPEVSAAAQLRWLTETRETIGAESSANGDSAALVYCSEIEPATLVGEQLWPFLEQCAALPADLSQMDDFTSNVARQMKARGLSSKRALVTIICGRRIIMCRFCITLLIDVLELGQEPQDPSPQVSGVAKETMSTHFPGTSTAESPPPSVPKLPRKCANPFCEKRETSSKFSVCGSCKKLGKQVPYCSRACQQAHWSAGHRAVCGKTPT